MPALAPVMITTMSARERRMGESIGQAVRVCPTLGTICSIATSGRMEVVNMIFDGWLELPGCRLIPEKS